MKRVLFIDRDGTLITEPPTDFQIDSLEKLEFVPGAITAMAQIAELDFELAMVTNQDGLGTCSFPEETFWPAQDKMVGTLAGEGVTFDQIFVDPSLPEQNLPTRKPGTAMLTRYFEPEYDLAGSFVIGDRLTDVILAKNLGAKAILFQPLDRGEQMVMEAGLECALITDDWRKIYEYLRQGERVVTIERNTRETQIKLTIDLDGRIESSISTGLNFFDHMLDQIVHHGGISMQLTARGDIHVDEHHTIEDVAIVLGEAVKAALGDKRGIERYGYALPMDDCRAMVLLDFGGRAAFEWDASFARERIGDVHTEMFRHFFKSLSDAAACNLHITARGENEHHKIEAIFKAFARALRMARHVNQFQYSLPSSKGIL